MKRIRMISYTPTSPFGGKKKPQSYSGWKSLLGSLFSVFRSKKNTLREYLLERFPKDLRVGPNDYSDTEKDGLYPDCEEIRFCRLTEDPLVILVLATAEQYFVGRGFDYRVSRNLGIVEKHGAPYRFVNVREEEGVLIVSVREPLQTVA
jgi:hypothetical protein